MSELEQLKTEFQTRRDIALGDRNVMRGILSDCLYDDKAKVNQLLAAFDCGVVDKIVSEHNPNEFFVHRMITELENDYGFPQQTCGWVVESWIELIHGDKFLAALTTTTKSIPKQTPSKKPKETVIVLVNPKEEPKDYNAILEAAKKSLFSGDYQQAEISLNEIINGNKEDNIWIQAYYYFGLMYDMNESYTQALKYYKIASDRGYAKSFNNLGVIYNNGKGVAKDVKLAAHYFELAVKNATQNDDISVYKYNLKLANHTTTTKSAPKQSPSKKPQETVKVPEKPIEEPTDYNAILEVAKNCVINGDYQQAEKRLKTIIMNSKEENICIQANFYLGLMYDRQKNYIQALKCYQIAAYRGYAKAHNKLGVIYYNGKGVTKNVKLAVRYFERAVINATQNDDIKMYSYNLGLSLDDSEQYNRALVYYTKAAELGHAEAQNNLGVLHYKGRGTVVDNNQAEYWWQQSVKNGNKNAEENLKKVSNETSNNKYYMKEKTEKTKEIKQHSKEIIIQVIMGLVMGVPLTIYGLFEFIAGENMLYELWGFIVIIFGASLLFLTYLVYKGD